MFVQIHARSLLPCQDTPAIKATYSSKVKSTSPVLMSGLRISPPSEETPSPGKEAEYVYEQVSYAISKKTRTINADHILACRNPKLPHRYCFWRACV